MQFAEFIKVSRLRLYFFNCLSCPANAIQMSRAAWAIWAVRVKRLFFQVRLRTEVLCAASSTRVRFELMTSRSWQYIWFKHILFHLHEKGLGRAEMLCWSPLPVLTVLTIFHVTETPALTTWPSVTSYSLKVQYICICSHENLRDPNNMRVWLMKISSAL